MTMTSIKRDLSANTYTGLDQSPSKEDLMRSQCLIAKMSGNPVPKGSLTEKKYKVSHRRVWAEEFKQGEEVSSPSPAKDGVDAWIRRIQDADHRQGAFVYLRQEDPDDPYNLVYCSYKDSERRGGRFYTLSKKGFTAYYNGKASEFLSIIDWIMERELYAQIKAFTFFKLFRLWRDIKFWQHNAFFERRKSIKESLERKMMLTKKGYAKLLVQHRATCRKLEGQRLFDTSEPDEVLTLKQFAVLQETHMKKMANIITEASARTKERFLHKITKDIDRLKKKVHDHQLRMALENDAFPLPSAIPAKMPDKPDAVYERLGFPSNLSYSHRTDVRKACKMFVRFSYLLDFIAKTSLKSMYVSSMRVFDQYLARRIDVPIPPELPLLKIVAPEFVADRNCKPVLLFQVELNEEPVEDAEVKFALVPAYERPPVGKIDENSFDPTCHLQLLDDYFQSESAADALPDKVIIGRKVRSAYVCSGVEKWLRLSPEVSELAKVLKACVKRMLDVVTINYERYGKSEPLRQYANVLEDWEESLAGKWKVSGKKRFLCEDMLEDEPEYKERETIVDRHMEKLQANVGKYFALFGATMLRYWRYSRIPWDLVTNSKLRESVDVLTLLVKQLKKQKEDFSLRIPSKADLGFCRLNLLNLREKVTAAPTQALKKMDFLMV